MSDRPLKAHLDGQPDMAEQPLNQVIDPEVAALIAAAKSGDDEALGQLSDVYRGYLLHIASQELGNDLRAKVGASDLVQEALVDFRTTIRQLRGDSDLDLRAYLRQILLNRVAYVGRRFRQTSKRDIQKEISLNDAASSDAAWQLVDKALTPRSNAIAVEDRARIQSALSRLPDDYRAVIELRTIAGKSWHDVGIVLNRQPEAVRKLWSRAIEELCQVWDCFDDSE